MLDPKLIAAQLDGRVLATVLSAPLSMTIAEVAAAAGTDMAGLRNSMRRLAIRQPGVTWPWAGVSEFDKTPLRYWPAERVARMV